MEIFLIKNKTVDQNIHNKFMKNFFHIMLLIEILLHVKNNFLQSKLHE